MVSGLHFAQAKGRLRVAREIASGPGNFPRGRSPEEVAEVRRKVSERKKSDLELLAEFDEGDIVSNGRLKAKVKSKDEQFAQLIVRVLPMMREEKWKPEHLTIIEKAANKRKPPG